MKLGSLFSGSGGFELAGALSGITPTWASEVEPFPIRVTTKRFPNMKHLGDISKVKGNEIDPVDVITFGSPCQDLSVAGKRKGLNHSELGDEETTRSGLFMEAVRIIREMKEATNGEYPTFAVWENVPGAYSSNKGEDFRIVLEELEKTASGGFVSVPKPPKGKWLNAGEIVGDNYSIAWRTLDAQFWGVPQRRRRIYLVADFRGKRAGKILFEREGLRGNFTQSGTPWQGTAGNAEKGTGAADRAECIAFDTYNMVPTNDVTVTLRANSEYNYAPVFVKNDGEPILTAELGIASRDGGHCYENIAGTLRANAGDNQLSVVYAEEREKCVVYDGSSVTSPINAQNPELGDPCHTLNTDSRNYVVIAVENHPADSRVNIDDSGKVQTLTSRMGTGGGNVPLVMEPKVFENHSQDTRYKGPLEVAQTVSATYGMSGNNQPFVVEEKPVYCLQGNGIDRADTTGCNGKGWKEDTSYTLNTVDRPAVAYSLDSLASNSMKSKNPHSGCRMVDRAKTLDTSTQDPSKNQGGIAIVQHCQGIDGYNSALTGDKSSTLGVNCGMSTGRNGILCYSLDRASYNQGINAQYDIGIDDSGTAHTLVAKGPGTVCYWNGEQVSGTLTANNAGGGQRMPDKDNFNCIIEKKPQLASGNAVTGCLMASGYDKLGAQEMFSGDYTVIDAKEPHYIVRRLTPLECCRLQGFPDWWCSNLETDNPTESDIEFWREVFETHRTVISGTSKPKTDKQIIKWLKDPYSDSAIYKMWGNGICLQNALFVIQGIAEELKKEKE